MQNEYMLSTADSISCTPTSPFLFPFPIFSAHLPSCLFANILLSFRSLLLMLTLRRIRTNDQLSHLQRRIRARKPLCHLPRSISFTLPAPFGRLGIRQIAIHRPAGHGPRSDPMARHVRIRDILDQIIPRLRNLPVHVARFRDEEIVIRGVGV